MTSKHYWVLKAKVVFMVLCLSWFLRHFFIIPTFDETTITGFEFKINFSLPNGKKQ